MPRPSMPGRQIEQQQGARWGANGYDPAWWFDDAGRMVVNTELLSAGPGPVVDADFWWRPDTYDSALPINQAIDYVSSRGGGTVRLGPHTYTLHSPVRIHSGNIGLEGVANSKLFLASGANCFAITVGYRAANPTYSQMIEGNFVRGMEIDGNGWTQTHVADAVYAYARSMGVYARAVRGLRVDDCYVHDTLNTGIGLQRCQQSWVGRNRIINAGYTPIASPRNGVLLWDAVPEDLTGTVSKWSFIVENFVHGFSDIGVGLSLNGQANAVIANNVINANHDIFLEASGYLDNWECIAVEMDTVASDHPLGQVSIVGNVTRQGVYGIAAWSARGGGVDHYAEGISIVGNSINLPRTAGVYVSGRQITVEDNVVNQYGWDPDDAAYGIRVLDVNAEAAATEQKDIIIRGNILSAYIASQNAVEASTGNVRTGISLFSDGVETRTGITIEGNHIVGAGLRALALNWNAGVHAEGQNHNLSIRNNEIRDHHKGITVRDWARNLAIEHNRITGCNSGGIHLQGTAGTPITLPRIHGNVIASNACWSGAADAYRSGIYLNQVALGMLESNVITDNNTPPVASGYAVVAQNCSGMRMMFGHVGAHATADVSGTAQFDYIRWVMSLNPCGTFNF